MCRRWERGKEGLSKHLIGALPRLPGPRPVGQVVPSLPGLSLLQKLFPCTLCPGVKAASLSPFPGTIFFSPLAGSIFVIVSWAGHMIKVIPQIGWLN